MQKPYRTILITGASTGIGAALARVFAAECECLVLTARRGEALAALAASISDCHVEVVAVDLANADKFTRELGARLATLPPCDLAILNAGVSRHLKPGLPQLGLARDLFAVNFFGAIATLDLVLPGMKARDCGQVVAIASVAGFRGLPGSAAYCSSKAALRNFMESVRCDLVKSKVRICTIYPGFIRTEMTQKNRFKMPFIMDVEEAAKQIQRAIRLRKTHYAFPWQYRWLFRLLRLVPDSFFPHLFRRGRKDL